MQEKMIAMSLQQGGGASDDVRQRAAFGPVSSAGREGEEVASPSRGSVQVGGASPGAHLQGYASARRNGGR